MTSPHFVSSEEFARELIQTIRELTSEEKAECRLSLYLWASVRLAEKPAEN